MAFAFDSLGYARRLRDAGIAQDQAEAHADAAREFIMTELVTRHDLQILRGDLDNLRRELKNDIQLLDNKFDILALRLTVRMGVMLAAGLSILAAVLRLHP